MLTWTRTKPDQALTLTFRERSRFFTRELFFAFTIAFCLHLFFGILFKIELGMLKDPEQPAPATVIASPSGAHMIAEQEPIRKNPLPFLETARPTTPTLRPSPYIQEKAAFTVHALKKLTFHAAPYFSKGVTLKTAPPETLSIETFEPFHAALNFEADPRSGVIYYLSWQEKTGNTEWDKKIESYVKSLRLSIPPSTSPYGEINIQFMPVEEKASYD